MNTKQSGENYVTHPLISVRLAIDRWLNTNVPVSISIIFSMIGAFIVPVIAISAALFANSSPSNTNVVDLSPALLVSLGVLIFLVMVGVILPLAIALDYTFISSQNGKQVSYKSAVKRGYKRIFITMATYFLAVLAIVLGLILLIIPGIYIALRLSYLNSVVAYEDRGPIENLKRAFALSKSNLWDIIGVVSAAVLVSSAFSILTSGVLAATPDNVFSVSLVALVSVASFVAGLFMAQAIYFRYHQSALEKEHEITKIGTDKLNYWLFFAAFMLSSLDGALSNSQPTEFNIDDFRGSV